MRTKRNLNEITLADASLAVLLETATEKHQALSSDLATCMQILRLAVSILESAAEDHAKIVCGMAKEQLKKYDKA